MTVRDESAERPAFPERLRAAIPITLPLRVPIDEAVGRLRLAVETGAQVDVGSLTTDRRLTGQISGESVRLSVLDSDWAHRRKGWRIEFVGRFESAPLLALRGTVGIATTNFLRGRIWLLRLAALVPLGFGIGSALAIPNNAAPPIFDALFGTSIGLIALGVYQLLERSIETAAADDGRVLTDYVGSQLE
jgi:hypothetical protein